MPDLIVKILSNSGYDTAIALAEFDESDIEIVQEYTNKNLLTLVKQYEVYSDIEQFVFLPGHRKLLFSLSKRVKDYLDERVKSKESKKSESRVECNAEKNCEVNAEKNGEKSEERSKSILKTKLLSRLCKITKKCGLTVEFSEDCISEIVDYASQSRTGGKTTASKCTVKCVICSKEVSCIHNSYWQTSNLENHFQLHVKRNELTPIENETNSLNETSTINQIAHKNTARTNSIGKNNTTSTTSVTDKNNNPCSGTKTIDITNNEELDQVLGLQDESEKN